MREIKDMGVSPASGGRAATPSGPSPTVSGIAGIPDALTAMERETLTAWRDCYVGYGFGFAKAAELCETPRHNIRRAVRSLARKGMLEYARSLFWEDEAKMGAGYTLTEAGSITLDGLRCTNCEDEITVEDGLCRPCWNGINGQFGVGA